MAPLVSAAFVVALAPPDSVTVSPSLNESRGGVWGPDGRVVVDRVGPLVCVPVLVALRVVLVPVRLRPWDVAGTEAWVSGLVSAFSVSDVQSETKAQRERATLNSSPIKRAVNMRNDKIGW